MSVDDTQTQLSLFQKKFKKEEEQKLLEEALLYLRLRDAGCPKMKSLIFTKKKAKNVDATKTKDGPAGYRKLVPQKPDGIIQNGWVKGKKLQYQGLRGFSEQIRRNQSKEKKNITGYNQIERKQLEVLRQKRQLEKQRILKTNKDNIIDQINDLKDEVMKNKEKRSLFLSYNGQRLDQMTRQYFENIEALDSNSLVLQLSAFNQNLLDPRMEMETDWDVARGRTMSSNQIDGANKRKGMMDFRKSLSNLQIPKPQSESDKKFRVTLQNSQKRLWQSNNFGKSVSKERKSMIQRQLREFEDNIHKILLAKSKRLKIQ